MGVTESIGYAGTVTDVQWGRLAAAMSNLPNRSVLGMTDWQMTNDPNVDRGVTVAAGRGYGDGILDTATATALQCAPTSTTRYDTIVAERNWQTGQTTMKIRQGNTFQVVSAGVLDSVGVVADQVIGLAKVTAGSSTLQIIDLRNLPWRGPIHEEWSGGFGGILNNTVTGIGTTMAPEPQNLVGPNTYRINRTAQPSQLSITNPTGVREVWLVEFLTIFTRPVTGRSLIEIVDGDNSQYARAPVAVGENITSTSSTVVVAPGATMTLAFRLFQVTDGTNGNGVNYRCRFTRL